MKVDNYIVYVFHPICEHYAGMLVIMPAYTYVAMNTYFDAGLHPEIVTTDKVLMTSYG